MVFVLDANKRILTPCRPKRARILLNTGKAKVFRNYPFTIILKREVLNASPRELRVKLDPGSKKTGIAVLDDTNGKVVFAGEIEHRGHNIKESLDSRRAIRRGRRFRTTRYRQARWLNRTRPIGWLAPSLESRIANILTWVKRLSKFSNIKSISQELVKFDTQQMDNPEISGVEYQQGTLFGYEVREYLLEKWQRKCAYCGKSNTALEIEHIIPKSRGGSNKISNLTLACNKCNLSKGNKTAEEFGFKEIQKQAKKPLKDAAAVNSTRWKLYNSLKIVGLPIEVGSGGLTKFNRITRKLAKEHWIDALCVGKSTPEKLDIENIKPLQIKATGHGSRQMCLVDKYGFPRTKAKSAKVVKGFQTGDIVKAIVDKGKKIGTYIGKVAIRVSGSFNISTLGKVIQGISYKYLTKLHSCDGYSYA